ncbi:MAG: hypothetical protein E7628_02885 [Ruminococcaceae bacterium]|nr:hypothetical protein [Oscillospiraceae bacterium]
MKKLLAIILSILVLLPLIAGCTPTPAPTPETNAPETDAPETDAPETDAPETDAPETDAPETDAPETDAPETDAPETDAPETDAPETDAPETDAPEVDSLALAADSPIKNYDIVEFVPENKNDPDCQTGFVMQAVKYKYKNDDIIVVHLTNATETAYTVRLTVKYIDENGKAITGVRETIPDVGAGWDNYYIFNPDFKFESFGCSLSISNTYADSVTASIKSTGAITSFAASSGLYWTDPSSLRSEVLDKEYTAVYAKIPYENTSAEALHIIADYMFFDEDGKITIYDTFRIPAIASVGQNEAIVPLKLTSKPWDNGNGATADDYSGELTGIVAYRSILNDAAAEANRVKSTTADFGAYTFEAQNGVILPYRLYLPSDYDETKKYPLLAIFHANGSQGKDNEKHMGDVEKFFGSEESPAFDCIIFAPQCPENGWWLGENTDAGVELMDFLNATFSTDKSRQYVTGFSMGGCATWNILTRYPEKVSAAVPCAYAGGQADISEIDNPIYTDILIIHYDGSEEFFALPEEALEVPIYFVFGSADETIPPEQCRFLVEAFESVDAQNFYYKEFGGVDHGNMGATYISKYNGYEHLYWLLEQRRETE